MGSFVEKAEIIGPTLVDFVSLESKIFRSCLHIEVKVVEDTLPSRSSRMSSSQHAVSKATSISSFILCTGLLQKDSVGLPSNGSNKEASMGDIPYDKQLMLMDPSSIVSLDDVSSVDTLDTGEYDVLLFTPYSPVTELDTQLVGTARVRVEIDGVNKFTTCVHHLQQSYLSVYKEMDDLIYLCNDDSLRCSHFHRCWEELADCTKFLQFAAYVVDSTDRLMAAHREVVASKGLSTELAPLQIHINNLLVVHSNQRNKLLGAMGFVLATIARIPHHRSFGTTIIDIVTHLVDSASSSSSPAPVRKNSAVATRPPLLSVMLVVQKYFQVHRTAV